jgi:hypothetical protein
MNTPLLKTLDFEINTEPIIIGNGVTPDHKAITNSDTGEVMGIVGRNYSPITNEAFMLLANELQKTGEFAIKGYDALRGGKLVLGFLEYQEKNLFINGCGFTEHLVLINSHDGSRPFYAGSTNNLARCENQFFSSIKIIRKKHNSRLVIDQYLVHEIVNSYKRGRKTIYDKMEKLDKIKVDDKVVEDLIRDLHARLNWDSAKPKPGEKVDTPSMNLLRQCIYKEMGDIGKNAFGLFNGVTWYTTHAMRSSHQHFGNTEGTAQLMNQRAFQFVTKLKLQNQ